MFDDFFACPPHAPGQSRAKWGWDASFMNGFFGAEGRPRGRWRGGRMFEQGEEIFWLAVGVADGPDGWHGIGALVIGS